MLILPSNVFLLEGLSFGRRWWWFGDLGNEICRRCLGHAIDQHAKQGNLEEDEEGDCEAIQDAFAVAEPCPLLLRIIAYAGKVGLELWTVS